MHDLEINDLSEDNEEIKLKKVEIQNVIQRLEGKLQEYGELEKALENNGVNEINFTDPDAKTVKFGAHQGTRTTFIINLAKE